MEEGLDPSVIEINADKIESPAEFSPWSSLTESNFVPSETPSVVKAPEINEPENEESLLQLPTEPECDGSEEMALMDLNLALSSLLKKKSIDF